MSRTSNSIKNITSGIVGFLATDLLELIVRTVFIYQLGREYLGLNSLFNNILTLLSISELGIGTSIVYNLYEPIAQNNVEKIKSYMRAFKLCYRCIAAFILTVGLILVPFLDFFISSVPDIVENYRIIYLFFLANTVFSYLLTYKRSLVIASQQLSVVNICTVICKLIFSILQIITLFIFHKYYLYLIILVSSTLSINLYISHKCDRMYPYLKEKSNKLSKEEWIDLFKNVKAMFLYRVCDNFMSGTDSLFISKFINIVTVGLYSNYITVSNTVRTILTKMFEGITASIGNLNVLGNNSQKINIFYVYNFAAYWLNGFAVIALYCLLPDFIKIWIGEDYLLPKTTLLLIVILFYIVGILIPVSNYRYATGLFRYGQVRALFMPIVNIIASYILVKIMGLNGIFVGTILARVVIQIWYDPWIVFKHGFKTSVKPFYFKNLKYILMVVVAFISTSLLCNLIEFDNLILSFILKFIICVIIPNLEFCVFNYYSNEFRYLANVAKRLIKKNLKIRR